MHRHLPWCTVYVTLSALDGSSSAESNGMYVTTSTPSSVVEMSANASTQAAASAVNIKSPSEGFLQAGQEMTDDIRMPLGEEDSRSFLCMVNSAGCVIKWLGYELLDESNMQVMNPNATVASGGAFGATDANASWMHMYPQFYPQQQASDPDAMATQQQQWMAYQQWVMMMQAQAAQYQHQQQHGQDHQGLTDADGVAGAEGVDAVTGNEHHGLEDEPDAKRVKTDDDEHEGDHEHTVGEDVSPNTDV